MLLVRFEEVDPAPTRSQDIIDAVLRELKRPFA